MVEEQGLMMH